MIIDTKHGKISIHYPDDHISRELMHHKEYEWYVIEIIAGFINTNTTGIFLDIGANIGTVTIPIADHYPDVHVHAFELQPHIIDILKENISLNNVESNITIHEFGLGNVATKMKLQMPVYAEAKNIGGLSLNNDIHQYSDISKGQGEVVEIEVKTLDSIKFDQPIRCIKIDVEGFEQQVLEGALETLKEHNYPPIVYELWSYNPWWQTNAMNLKSFLINLGYTLTQQDDTGIAIYEKLSS